MEIEEIIIKIQNLIRPSLSKESEEREQFPVGFTFYHILERIDCNLTSLRLLSQNILKHDHAIGLVSRNLLSDFFIVCHILANSESKEDHKWFYSLYNADLKKMDSYIKIAKEQKLTTDSHLQDIENKYSAENSIYKIIRNNSTVLNVQTFPNISQIAYEFMNAFKDHILAKQVILSYDIWLMLSKYEHIGLHSYTLTREVDIENSVERLKIILSMTVLISGCCLEELNDINSKNALGLSKEIYCA